MSVECTEACTRMGFVKGPQPNCGDRARNQPIAQLKEPLGHILTHAHCRADVAWGAEEVDYGGPGSAHIQQSSLASLQESRPGWSPCGPAHHPSAYTERINWLSP